MKEVVDHFCQKGIVFAKLQKLDPKALGIRMRIELFWGVDTQRSYTIILRVKRKSRILQKDAKMYDALVKALPFEHAFRNKYLLYDAPLCVRAKEYLRAQGWRVDALV